MNRQRRSEVPPVAAAAYLSTEDVRNGLLEVMAFLASAASLNVDEGPGYGHMRILEAVQRSFRVLRELRLADEELSRAAVDLDRRVHTLKNDPAAARDVADQLADLFVTRLTSGLDSP